MDTIYTTLLNTVGAFFLTETWRVACQCVRKLLLVVDRIDELTDHRMLGSSDQVEILALDLVHHGIHLIKTHNAGYYVGTDHKRRYTVSESAVDHEISCVRDNCGVDSCNVAHQVVESVSGNFSCCIKIDTVETLHNVCVIWNLKIRNNRLTKLLDLYVAAIVFSDRNGRIDDVRDGHHNLGNLLGQLLLLCLKLRQTGSVCSDLSLDSLCLFLLTLCHQCTDLLGDLVLVCTKLISLCLCGTGLCVQLDHFINEWKLVILELLLDVLLNNLRVLS